MPDVSSLNVVSSKLVFLAVLALVVLAARPSDGQTFTVLHTFTGTPDGEFPQAGLVMDAQGNLYGTTNTGGNKYNWGTVFELTLGGTETIIHTFSGGATASPWGSNLILDAQGNLYGTSLSTGPCGPSCGSVFEITSLQAFKVRYRFESPASGEWPFGTLVEDGEGNLYGVTNFGGASGMGTVLKVTPTGVETILHSFAGGKDGAYPNGLTIDAHGSLYGTTGVGGTGSCNGGCGTVFKITPSGSKSILYSFKAAPDGNDPSTGLILDTDGNLYGTTISGGAYGDGAVFKLTPSRIETVLYSFAGGTDGDQPLAPLVMDTEGNLYSTTSSGGASCSVNYLGCGTVYKLAPDGTETVLHRFSGGADGWNPQAGLVLDSQGNLYGTATSGGDFGVACPAYGCGTVFKLTP
jgi:uncharacterized repeat protein (TIGR03803 family)